MSSILVVNSGSSSFKYQLIDTSTEQVLASGLVERIGEETGKTRHTTQVGSWTASPAIADHTAGFEAMLAAFEEHGPSFATHPLVAVGHRVVHGGKRFHEATVITDLVKINIEDLSELAPLHNPANLEGITAAQRAFPDVPQVAGVRHGIPSDPPARCVHLRHRPLARREAAHPSIRVPRHVAQVRGRCHGGIPRQAHRVAEDDRAAPRHGASACAIDGGRSVETSMGMTPLEGLVMGTRSGDIDPAVLFHLNRKTGMGFAELDDMLNRGSGLLGLSGRGDMRDVQKAAADGDDAAALALEVYLHRIRGYVGSYSAQLGHLDAIVFTAGVGENNPLVRARALEGLSEWGIAVDPALNERSLSSARRISPPSGRVEVLVVPTNEELEIARQSLAAVAGS